MKPAVHTARPPSQSGRPAGETGEDQASRIELSEIDVMRLDAAFRALPDHVDRPDGPAPAIENSLLAAARIQASINRQRWCPPQPPQLSQPAPERRLSWLTSLAICVIAVSVLLALWELGSEGRTDHRTSGIVSIADDAGLTPPGAAADPSYDPAVWVPIAHVPAEYLVAAKAGAAPVGGPVAAAGETGPGRAAGFGAAPPADAAPYPPEGRVRRPLHSRERPQHRHFGEPGPVASAPAAQGPDPAP